MSDQVQRSPDNSFAQFGTHNRSLRNYLYYSTLVGVFSAVLTVRVPFAIRLFDLIMITNLLLMSVMVNLYRISAWILYFIFYLAASGAVGIVNGTDSTSQVAKEFLGISVSLLYFHYFFRFIRQDFERAFLTYAKFAYWFAIIGFPLWVYSCIKAHAYDRLHSLTTEPAAFCELILPAFYLYAWSYFKTRKHGVEVLVFSAALVLSGSSLGLISVAFGVVLLLSRRIKHFVTVPVVVGGILVVAYQSSPYFRLRVDDTLLAVATEDVSGANISTYALLSNVFITQQVIKESPVLGNGLGSHPISHDRYIGDVPGVGPFIAAGSENINAPDAASFTLRVLSELGLLGYLGVLFFVFHFYVGGSSPNAAISNALLVYFFLKLIRGGLYFPPEQFFFVFIYILNYRDFKSKVGGRARRLSWGYLKPRLARSENLTIRGTQ